MHAVLEKPLKKPIGPAHHQWVERRYLETPPKCVAHAQQVCKNGVERREREVEQLEYYEERIWRFEGREEQPAKLPEAMVKPWPMLPLCLGPLPWSGSSLSIMAHVTTKDHVDVPGLICHLGP